MRRHTYFFSAALALLLVGSATTTARAQGYLTTSSDEPEISVGGFTALGNERLYVVQPGDTLWDLSESFLDDTWMWPTLWALNPQVTNPHWIYPGDVLVIRPPDAELQTESVVLTGSRFSEAPRNTILPVRNMGFIGTEDYEESGRVSYSREDKAALGEFDEVYLNFSTARNIREGDELTLYRVDRELEHPETEEDIGHIVRFLGIVRMLDVSKPLKKALIIKSFEEIYRGDLVTEIFQHTRMLQPVTNTIEQDALLLAIFDDRILSGEHQYVFIDKGSQNKVRTGNRFVIVERGDPYVEGHTEFDYEDEDEDDMDRFPWENVGEIIVIEPYENHSLGVITRSLHEIHPGAHLRMIDRY